MIDEFIMFYVLCFMFGVNCCIFVLIEKMMRLCFVLIFCVNFVLLIFLCLFDRIEDA